MTATTKLVRALALAGGFAGLAYLLLGLALHTSEDPSILGRWSGLQTSGMLLVVMALFAWKPLVDWCARADRLRLGGRSLVLSPGRKLALSCLVPALLLLGFEAAFRARWTAWHADELRDPAKGRRAFHPFLQNALYPHPQPPVNREGFRGEEIARQKPDGTFRVFLLGGSSVLAGRIPFEKTHARLLERGLRTRHPERRIEVQNAGNHWHTTQHSIIKYLFRIRDYDPDLVVVWHAVNDLLRSFVPDEYAVPPYRNDYGHYHGAVAKMVREHFDPRPAPLVRLYLAEGAALLARDLYSDLRAPPALPEEVEIARFRSLPVFAKNLEILADALARDGVPLVLGTQPCIYRENLPAAVRPRLWIKEELAREGNRVPSAASMARGMRAFNAATRALARRRGIPLVDLAAAVPRTWEYFLDDCHLSERGNRVVADALLAHFGDGPLPAAPSATTASRGRPRRAASGRTAASP